MCVCVSRCCCSDNLCVAINLGGAIITGVRRCSTRAVVMEQHPVESD